MGRGRQQAALAGQQAGSQPYREAIAIGAEIEYVATGREPLRQLTYVPQEAVRADRPPVPPGHDRIRLRVCEQRQRLHSLASVRRYVLGKVAQ